MAGRLALACAIALLMAVFAVFPVLFSPPQPMRATLSPDLARASDPAAPSAASVPPSAEIQDSSSPSSAVSVWLPPIGNDCNGYAAAKRDAFDGWAPGVRDAVAREEGHASPPSGHHLDHHVPIADAWRSGGCNWSILEWRVFYNDTDNLNYLPASENLAKSDNGPADWTFDCAGVLQWIATKAKWGLRSDARERTALERGVAECDDAPFAARESTRRPAPPVAVSDGSRRRSYEKNCNGRWEDIGKPGYFGHCYE